MTIADACAAFHRYQLTWTPDRIVIGADDKPYFQFDREASGGHDTWPFDAPQYLILNIAVGGTWGGQKGVDHAIFPARMEVDYVRVYQLAQDAGVDPGEWPQVRSRGLVDAATEARIDELLAKMSLEEKVGQISHLENLEYVVCAGDPSLVEALVRGGIRPSQAPPVVTGSGGGRPLPG